MAIAARIAQLIEIAPLRESYREEMKCQIIHDSIHGRHGWTREYALELNGTDVGYGSVAMAGPWRESHALYEFYVQPAHRMRTFDLFASLLAVCDAKIIETQTNDRLLTTMLHTFTTNLRAEKILFEDGFETSYAPPGAQFRAACADDIQKLCANAEGRGVRSCLQTNAAKLSDTCKVAISAARGGKPREADARKADSSTTQ